MQTNTVCGQLLDWAKLLVVWKYKQKCANKYKHENVWAAVALKLLVVWPLPNGHTSSNPIEKVLTTIYRNTKYRKAKNKRIDYKMQLTPSESKSAFNWDKSMQKLFKTLLHYIYI